ncbi:MAG TPA: cyclopentanol dehydrogenase [Dehalococcoidia bacterium]|nr:glucose 1-dehydrogenase [Candidatus Thalassarchaeum sp.]HAC20081.1 cyclopentanol dehydrogenase [Dehalococcoidia bacterium]HBJ31245.1 cyclopentanol dehydrogenase [Dehalococcoidia bacterium]HCH09510.1 cyclopentanol dehydrogenase [Dehalococcoidia bacterium]HIM91936.1 glucose 1-dehydrogenase [Dehalococcoidia bacterium]
MGRLDGKVALISGGSKGQGAAEAKLFAQEGAKVVLADILDDEGKKIEAEINETGGEAMYLHLDVTSEADWAAAVRAAVDSYGKLDILVNNAGILLRKGVEETSAEEWDRIQDVNSKGVFLGVKAAIPAMREAGGGSIVNISSIAGLRGSTSTAYGASKGLVRLLTKSTAVQYGPEGIRCNSVHPGIIETDMTEEMLDSVGREQWLARTPLRIIANAHDVALGVLYLASDESRYVTGSELVIDGGITA